MTDLARLVLDELRRDPAALDELRELLDDRRAPDVPPGADAVLTVPALLSIAAAAHVLGVSADTVRRRIDDGALPAVVEGDRLKIRGDDLRAYVDGLRRPGGVPARRRRARAAGGRFDFLRERDGGNTPGTDAEAVPVTFPTVKDLPMSVHRKDSRWVVRWRDTSGRQRSRSFPTKRQAVEFDRDRQRDARRDSVAMPASAVSAATAGHKMTFVVVENLYESGDEGPTPQRPIHEGYFPTIALADAYRQQMPDADSLAIRVLYHRYPVRDLTDEEIAAGDAQLDLASGNDNWIARVMRRVDEPEVTR